MKNDGGNASTRAKVAASEMTLSFAVTRAITRLRQAPINAADTVTPNSNAPMGRIRRAWPEGATTPKATWLAHAGNKPMAVTIAAAIKTSR